MKKTVHARPNSRSVPPKIIPGTLSGELAQLRTRVTEAEGTLRAIRSGEVDVVVVTAKKGVQLFTLEGAEHAYRVLIESMNEGALTLTGKKIILYANKCFARMVKCPLEQVAGGSFRRFLSPADRLRLRPMMKQAARNGSKMQVLLHAADGSLLPVQISVREIPKTRAQPLTIGMIVTDMTEVRRSEEMLRALTHRVVQVQEAERSRVALELHDNITQLLCGILFSTRPQPGSGSAHADLAANEAMKLRELIGQAAGEVERISRELRPSVLEHLGLLAVLRTASKEFAKRTGVAVKLTCGRWKTRLPADTELALYRIFQEAFKNVEQHARARHVTVRVFRRGAWVHLVVEDDGIGFDLDRLSVGRKEKSGLDLLGMRERAGYVGGTLEVKSARYAGTRIDVRVPLLPRSEGS